jgi:hypothetical protein
MSLEIAPHRIPTQRATAPSSRSAPADTVGQGHAVAGANCGQCGAVPDRGWRIGHALVNTTIWLKLHAPDI